MSTTDNNTPLKSASAADARPEHDAPILMYTPMTLDSSRLGQIITSPYPITINGVTVWSATPIHIIKHACPHYPVHIQSAAELGPEFERGWNNLPDELKVRVLGFAVVGKKPLTSMINLLYDHMFFIKLQRSTPEIATLSLVAYYSQNVFEVEPSHRSDRQPSLASGQYCFQYPPISVNKFIRTVIFDGNIGAGTPMFLSRMASGRYGFQNLRDLTVTITWYWVPEQSEFDTFMAGFGHAGIDFGCDGRIEFIYPEKIEDLSSAERTQMDHFMSVLKERVRFGLSKVKRGVVAS